MDVPLLGPSRYDMSPSRGAAIIINSFTELKVEYELSKNKEPDFYKNVGDFRIHLQDFKRQTFSVIEGHEYATEKKSSSSSSSSTRPSWFGPFGYPVDEKSKAIHMISGLLNKRPNWNSMDLMLFDQIGELVLRSPFITTLKVSAGYFDEFAHIWNSCNPNKVILNGIITRVKVQATKDNVDEGVLLKNHEVKSLTVSANSVIRGTQIEQLLRMSSGLREFHWESPRPSIRFLLLDIPGEADIIGYLNGQQNLEILSFYRHEANYLRTDGNFTLLNMNIKQNLLKLSTSMVFCPLTELPNFIKLQRLTYWWTEFLINTLEGEVTPIEKFIKNLPNGIENLQLYILERRLKDEEGYERYVRPAGPSNVLGYSFLNKLSDNLGNLISHANSRKFNLEICIVKADPDIWYYASAIHQANRVACIGRQDNRQTIFRKLSPIFT